MSATPLPHAPTDAARTSRVRQALTVASLSFSRSGALGRVTLPALVAFFPAALFVIEALVEIFFKDQPMGARVSMFASVFSLAMVRTAIFFGSLALFSGLVRRDLERRTLHYYFLAPMRRETLLVGKFLGALGLGALLFSLSTLLSLVALHLPALLSGDTTHLLEGPGLAHAFGYLFVALLALVGYGALFTFLGLFFKNPIVPAIVFWFIEFWNSILPGFLKRLSIIHYVEPLLPLSVEMGGIFAIPSNPPPTWACPIILLVIAAGLVAAAAFRLVRSELAYGSD